MAKQYDDRNRIVLFKVHEPKEGWPTLRATLTLADGTKLEAGLWPTAKKDRNGNTIYSGNLKPAEDRQPRQRTFQNEDF